VGEAKSNQGTVSLISADHQWIGRYGRVSERDDRIGESLNYEMQ
jgi:hypothetical protein